MAVCLAICHLPKIALLNTWTASNLDTSRGCSMFLRSGDLRTPCIHFMFIVVVQPPLPDSAVIQSQLQALQHKFYDRVINMYAYLIANYLYQTRYYINNSVVRLQMSLHNKSNIHKHVSQNVWNHAWLDVPPVKMRWSSVLTRAIAVDPRNRARFVYNSSYV